MVCDYRINIKKYINVLLVILHLKRSEKCIYINTNTNTKQIRKDYTDMSFHFEHPSAVFDFAKII